VLQYFNIIYRQIISTVEYQLQQQMLPSIRQRLDRLPTGQFNGVLLWKKRVTPGAYTWCWWVETASCWSIRSSM